MGYITNHKNRSPEAYPDRRGGGATTDAFARNSAVGPPGPGPQFIVGPTQVSWEIISSGAPAGTDIPITPAVSGIIRISAVLELKQSTGAPINAQIVVQLGGVDQLFPFTQNVTVPITGGIDIPSGLSVPVLAEIQGLTVGVTVNVQILVVPDDNGLGLVAESSSIDIQEVATPTG